MLDIVFYRPEIPPNTGNAMRLAAVTGCRLHLIEPLGFEMDDVRLRRAGLDYRDKAMVEVYPDLDTWRERVKPRRVFVLVVDGGTAYHQVEYGVGDAAIFGPESVGLPEEVQEADWVAARLHIPMVPGMRSLNLSNAAAVVVYEAWRQRGFDGATGTGPPNPVES
jgi:tRNA (cytidine/uridine-2'-O-)-methyltransferase